MTAFVIPFQRLVQFHPGHLQTQILLACHRRLAKLRSLAGSRVSTGPQNPTNLTAYTRLWKTNHLFVSQHFSGLLLVDERWDKLSLWTKRRLVCCLLDKQWIPCAQSSWTAGHTEAQNPPICAIGLWSRPNDTNMLMRILFTVPWAMGNKNPLTQIQESHGFCQQLWNSK